MNNVDDKRDPDLFLRRLKDEESQGKRGRLKIFFGAVAGVGKTFAMLEAARKLQKDGVDVVVGYVETHGRQETAALLEGLELLPDMVLEYKGAKLREFDLDKALLRKPEVILVDELAHSNGPGSRHLKRWQDVEELLQAGIDVYTTLNVQHIESLHDVIAQITGVIIRERVPDSLVERAFEIELIDLPPDELIERLKEGKVYIPQQAREALNNFFQKGNLIALRELALRTTAERVDEQMQQYRRSYQITEPWPTTERILVCISSSPLSQRLVRAAKRMAAGLRAKWWVAYVETPRQAHSSPEDKARVAQTLRLAEQLGAETIELTGNTVSEALIKCATQNNVNKIVIGKPAQSRLRELLFGSVVDDIIRQSGAIDVYVITGEEVANKQEIKGVGRIRSKPTSYVKALLVVLICTFAARMMLPYFELSNIIMEYMLGIVIVAIRYGRGPAVMASVLSVGLFDFFFVPPYLTFAVSDTQYVITFAVMLIVALVISDLTVRVKLQAESARIREQRTASLYSMSRELSSTLNLEDLIATGLKHVGEVFDSQVALFLPTATGKLCVFMTGQAGHALDNADEGVAQWAFKNKQPAGLFTQTLPAASALYVPLLGFNRAIGVLAIRPKQSNRFVSPEQLRMLETFANQMAIACERAYLSQENEATQLEMKTEQMRSSLLSSVSHDLRTPLATISGAASSILEGSEKLEINTCKELAAEIYGEANRLTRLIKNLLDMTRLQSGALTVKKELHPADEIIGAALNYMDDDLAGRTVSTDIPDDLPMIPVDPELIQLVLVNLLDNAVKYTLPASKINIRVKIENNNIRIEIADAGPGVPDEDKVLIFDKFFRRDSSQSSGVGLGLAICNAIIQAHQGKIWVEDRAEAGANFVFTLPLPAKPSAAMVEEPITSTARAE